jgi:hypothetical protein
MIRVENHTARSHHVAIVGSGPSGFYAAAALLDAEPGVRVDMYDRLATPWGLVRAGVAPDHPKIKSVSAQYDKTARREGFRFFGHVCLGEDISREDLLERYDAIIYAVGSQTERRLGIPGEDLPGSIASVDFVGWYNGHPDFVDLAPPLDTERAVVIGAGNVALDVARMLLLPEADLRATDTADHALDALVASGAAGRARPRSPPPSCASSPTSTTSASSSTPSRSRPASPTTTRWPRAPGATWRSCAASPRRARTPTRGTAWSSASTARRWRSAGTGRSRRSSSG